MKRGREERASRNRSSEKHSAPEAMFNSESRPRVCSRDQETRLAPGAEVNTGRVGETTPASFPSSCPPLPPTLTLITADVRQIAACYVYSTETSRNAGDKGSKQHLGSRFHHASRELNEDDTCSSTAHGQAFSNSSNASVKGKSYS